LSKDDLFAMLVSGEQSSNESVDDKDGASVSQDTASTDPENTVNTAMLDVFKLMLLYQEKNDAQQKAANPETLAADEGVTEASQAASLIQDQMINRKMDTKKQEDTIDLSTTVNSSEKQETEYTDLIDKMKQMENAKSLSAKSTSIDNTKPVNTEKSVSNQLDA